MIRSIAYYPILDLPLILYIGILTFLVFAFAATIAILNSRRIRVIPFQWHRSVAYTGLIIATIHGILGIGSHAGG